MANEIQTAPNTTPTTDADWAAELNLRELSMKGYDGISLTEWASGDTDRPQIAAGSVIEIDGAIAKFASQTALTDAAGIADGWCYIKFVVSGFDVVPTLTNTFGTWDTAKQGFYDGNDRYSLHAMYRSGAVAKIFTEKDIMRMSEAIMGFRYYEKQYTGTTDNTGFYGINITDPIFTPTEFYSTDAGWINSAGSIWLSTQGITGSGLQTKFSNQVGETGGISFLMATYYSLYGNKPYKMLVKYKLTL